MRSAIAVPTGPSSDTQNIAAIIRLRRYRSIILFVLPLIAVMQLAIESSFVNIVATTAALVSAIVTVLYCIDWRRFAAFPASITMLIGYNLTTSSVALLGQTLWLKPLSYNLDVPVQTFLTVTAFQLMLIATHFIYTKSTLARRFRTFLTSWVYAPLSLMRAPAEIQLWLMGFIGSFASWYTNVDRWNEDNYGNIGFKFLAGFAPYALAPFLIPVGKLLFGKAWGAKRTNWFLQAAYLMLIVAIAVARNSRGVFAEGILLILLCLMVAILAGNLIVRRNQIAVAIFVGVIAIIPAAALSDLGTAMVIVRSERSDISGLELISQTLAVAQNQDALDARKKFDAMALSGRYSEAYLDNIFLTRLAQTKFIDINFFLSNLLMEDGRAESVNQFFTRIARVFPEPIVTAFYPGYDKSKYNYSSGDWYNYYIRGIPLGGQKTGSSIADGLTVMGGAFPVFLFVIMLIKFPVFDGFAIRVDKSFLFLSPVLAINIGKVFLTGAVDESAADYLEVIIRQVAQDVFTYICLYYATRLIAGQRSRSKVKRQF